MTSLLQCPHSLSPQHQHTASQATPCIYLKGDLRSIHATLPSPLLWHELRMGELSCMSLVWVTSKATPGQGCSHPQAAENSFPFPFTPIVPMHRLHVPSESPSHTSPWKRVSILLPRLPGTGAAQAPDRRQTPISDVAQNHHSMQPVQSEPREICLCYFLQLIVWSLAHSQTEQQGLRARERKVLLFCLCTPPSSHLPASSLPWINPKLPK